MGCNSMLQVVMVTSEVSADDPTGGVRAQHDREGAARPLSLSAAKSTWQV